MDQEVHSKKVESILLFVGAQTGVLHGNMRIPKIFRVKKENLEIAKYVHYAQSQNCI